MRLSAFPTCYMDELRVTRSISLQEWIEMGATLGHDELELYPVSFHP